jgi:hypothetical protein
MVIKTIQEQRMKKPVMYLFLLLLSLSAAGCSFHHNIPMADIQVTPAAIRKQVPLKVAVVLPSENSVYTKGNASGGTDTIQAGMLLRKFSTELFPQLFSEVDFISGKPYPSDVSAIVIPTMENFSYEAIPVALGFGLKFEATVTLKLAMTDPDGMRIWSRVGKATKTSRDVVSPVIPVDELLGEATSLATLEALRDMAKEISIAREITAYAGNRTRPGAAAAAPVNLPVPREVTETTAATPAISSTDKLPAARPDAYAVVIGIDYKNRNDIPNLSYASRDARKVYDILTDLRYGGIAKENAVLLLNENATRNQMIAALRKIRSWNGYVYVYFSGHGAPKTKGEKFVDAFLIPSDVLISDPEAMEDTAITVSYLQELVDKSTAKGVLVALDACFSGGGKSILPKGGKPLVGMIAMPALIKPATAGKLVITSSATSQQSWEDDTEIKGGIFSHYLIEGLKGKAGSDVWVKADELAEYLKTTVPGAAYKLKQAEQTPQAFGKGDFSVTRNWDKAKVLDIDIARGKLKNTFEKGFITAEQLSKAMDDLKHTSRSKLLHSFLDGKISEKQFGELY